MEFSDVFREERYYCNHLFRLLCHNKESSGLRSGLGAILEELGMPEIAREEDIREAQIYTEVAVFRDVFAAETGKDSFTDHLYESVLPILQIQYNGRIQRPIAPSMIRKRAGLVHPGKYADVVAKFSKDEQDILFYREFSALFNAKPDFLVVIKDKMLWFEAKFWVSFSATQLRRTRTIADLCSSELFEKYFSRRQSVVVLLGSQARHTKAKSMDSTLFLSWEKCLEIALRLLPGGEANYTSLSFRRMLAM